MNPILRIAVNALGFNLGWFGCVLASRWDAPLAAIPVVALVVAVHLTLVARDDRMREARAVALIAAIGTVVDSAMLGAGVLAFGGSHALSITFVLWIGAFWVNFACTLGVALRWLRGRPILAAVLGGISAPGTYYAGELLGALTLHDDALVWSLALGIEWAIMLPLISALQARLTRPAAAPGPNPRGNTASAGTRSP